MSFAIRDIGAVAIAILELSILEWLQTLETYITSSTR